MTLSYHTATVLFLIFMRQSQWREQVELLGSSYLQKKFSQKAIPPTYYILTCYFCRASTLDSCVGYTESSCLPKMLKDPRLYGA